MSVIEIQPTVVEPVAPRKGPPNLRAILFRQSKVYFVIACLVGLIAAGFFGRSIARTGIDLRRGFWAYWRNNHYLSDAENAIHNARPVLDQANDIARQDDKLKSPEQLKAEQAQAAAGNPIATIDHPGPGLFEGDNSPAAIRGRWQRLKPVYSQIYRGWIANYESLAKNTRDDDYGLDYPPLRLMVMTLWTWKVQEQFPGLDNVPNDPQPVRNPDNNKTRIAGPDLLQPMLAVNTFFDSISAISVFFIAMLWCNRTRLDPTGLKFVPRWRNNLGARWLNVPATQRWGDRMLLLPPAMLLFMLAFVRNRSAFTLSFLPQSDSLIDVRVTSMGWWLFAILRVISVICLARFLPRPLRGLFCGLVGAALLWLSPPAILDSMGWPQWDVWLPPFFLLSLLFITLDWWVPAGIALGVGCMFKGQLMFVSPVLLLMPLFAGWIGKFIRIVAGMAAGMAVVVWPWMVTNESAKMYVIGVTFTSIIACIVARFMPIPWQRFGRWIVFTAKHRYHQVRGNPLPELPLQVEPDPVRKWIAISAAILVATIAFSISSMILFGQDPQLKVWTKLLAVAVAFVPFATHRKFHKGWIVFCFAASAWLAAASLNGSWSWWKVGFMYGTAKHPVMQLGAQSLSNLSSLLQRRYGWDLHDSVGTLTLPFVGTSELDLQGAVCTVYGLLLIPLSIAAAVHLRRRDPKFLVTATVPWLLFVVLLTQMTARYTILAAMISSCFIAVSAGMTMFTLLMSVIACMMLGNQIIAHARDIAPNTFALTSPSHPDFGWAMIMLAVVMFGIALLPSRSSTNSIVKPE